MSVNKITFGLKNVHIAFMESEGEWGDVVKVPGAVNFSPSPEGDTNVFHADDDEYFVVSANNGYTGDLEMANFTDEVMAEALGWEIDDNGMLVETSDGGLKAKAFALMGEISGDKRNRKFVYYNVKANRPSNENTTKTESIDPSTKTMPVTISPIEIGGRSIVKGDLELSDTNKAVFDSFFQDVYTPTFEGEE